jgi:dTDP-4-amino-4,6-dideoxygalactose transaminase
MDRPATPASPSPASSAPVPLFDIHRQYQQIKDEVLAAIAAVCESGKFILGPDCRVLEENLAALCGVRQAVACASGSDALLLALMALGIGPGDEVIVPSYTFFATASAVSRLGARPVFIDIEPAHFLLDFRLVEPLVTPRTKAIIPVHLFGQCVPPDDLLELAARRNLWIIEDAAQAIGAAHRGRPAGAMGHCGCFSFYPTKNLGGFGDGGLLTTHDDALAARLRLLRGHGMEPRYYHKVVGINSRLDSIQAAILKVKLRYLEGWTAARQENARRYAELFAACGLDRTVILPSTAPGQKHVWNQYVIRVPDGRRDALRERLAQCQVGTEIYYPVPLHLQECFRHLGYREGDLPETERAARETLALPIFPELTLSEQQRVVGHIAEFFGIARPGAVHGIGRPKFWRGGVRQREDA